MGSCGALVACLSHSPDLTLHHVTRVQGDAGLGMVSIWMIFEADDPEPEKVTNWLTCGPQAK